MMLRRWAVRKHISESTCPIEKFQVDKIKNGRLSAIIHLDRPDIAE